MKKLLILVIAMAMTWASYAQTASLEETGDKPHVMAEHIFGLLDKTPITSKRLWDKAIDFLPMDDYNGRYLSDSTNLDKNKFGYLYAMISMAITDNTTLPNPKDLYNYKVPTNAPIPIAVLLQRYNYIIQNAIPNNLVRLNADERLEDVPNRTQNPYGEDTLFAAISVEPYFNRNSPEMILPFSNFVSNIGHITNIKIDFGNGGIPIAFDQAFTPDLQSGINQKAVLSITLANGSVLRTRFIYHVANADGSFRNGPDLSYDLTNSTTRLVTATKGFDGGDGKGINFAKAQVTTYYSCSDKILRKPLIILDGFNPGFEGENELISDVLVKGYNGFIVTPLSSLPSNPRSIAQELRKEGYDIIFVDWAVESENGNDYIQRNAFLLEKILDEVNQAKRSAGSMEKNVMIGYSMGGLIGKYAILDQEKNNPNAVDGGHDIEKFFSYDSPLQGANIPLAGQAMLNDLGSIESKFISGITLRDLVPAINNNLKLLESPAAQQMLIYQYTASDALKPSKHIAFYDEINAMGKIKKCEFLTISNGSAVGIANFPASTNLLTWDFSKKINIVKKKAITLRMNLSVDALPDGTTGGPVSKTEIYDRNFNWWLFINRWTPLVSTKNHVEYKVKGAIRPLDSCPGGTTGLFSDAIEDLEALGGTTTSGKYLNSDGTRTQILRSTFIPIVSALDLRSPERGLDFTPVTTEPIVEGLASSGSVRMVGSRNITAFDYPFVGSNAEVRVHNQNHVAMTYRISARLLSELIKENPLANNFTNGTIELSDKTYNFGVLAHQPLDVSNFRLRQMSNIIDYPLVVNNTGKLWVNRMGKIGFINQVSNPNNIIQTAPYDLFIRITNTCQNIANVTLRDGGSMIIGEFAAVGAPARVNIERGTFLEIANGGLLTIDQGSQVRVRNGGRLRLNGGQFNTNFNSRITVENGANFNIDAGIGNIAVTTQAIIEQGGIASISGGSTNLLDEGTISIRNGGVLNITGGTLSLLDQSRIVVESGGVINISGGTQNLNNQSKIIVQNGGIVNITGGVSTLLGSSQFIVEQGGIVNVISRGTVICAESSIFEVSGRAFFRNFSTTTLNGNSKMQGTGEIRFESGSLNVRDTAQLRAYQEGFLVLNTSMNIQMNNRGNMLVEHRARILFDGSLLAPVVINGGNDFGESSPIALLGNCRWELNAPIHFRGSAFLQIHSNPTIIAGNHFEIRGDGMRRNNNFKMMELMEGAEVSPNTETVLTTGKIIYQDNSTFKLPGETSSAFFTNVYFKGNPDATFITALGNDGVTTPSTLNISDCLFHDVDYCLKLDQGSNHIPSGDVNIINTTAERFKAIGFDFRVFSNILIERSRFVSSERVPDYAYLEVSSRYAPAVRCVKNNSQHNVIISNSTIENVVPWVEYPNWVNNNFDAATNYSALDPHSPPKNAEMRTKEESYLVGVFGIPNFFLIEGSEVRGGYIGIATEMGEADGGCPSVTNLTIACSSVHDNYVGILMSNPHNFTPNCGSGTVYGGLILNAAAIEENVFGIYGRNIFMDANLTGFRATNTFGIKNNKGHYMSISYGQNISPTGPNGATPISNGMLKAEDNFWKSGVPQNVAPQINYFLSGLNSNGSSTSFTIDFSPAANQGADCTPSGLQNTDPTDVVNSATETERANVVINGFTKSLLPIYWRGMSEYLNRDVEAATTTLSEITAIPLSVIQESSNPYVRHYHTISWAIAPQAPPVVGGKLQANPKHNNSTSLIFPNPAEDYFMFSAPSGTYEVTLSDLLGRTVKQTQVNDYERVSTLGIQAGVYQVTLRKQGEKDVFKVDKLMIK